MNRRVRKLLDDLCRVLGHSACEVVFNDNPKTFNLSVDGTCTRCKRKVGSAKVKYSDLQARKYDVLNRLTNPATYKKNDPSR